MVSRYDVQSHLLWGPQCGLAQSSVNSVKLSYRQVHQRPLFPAMIVAGFAPCPFPSCIFDDSWPVPIERFISVVYDIVIAELKVKLPVGEVNYSSL